MSIFDYAEVPGFRCTGGQIWSETSNPVRTCHDLELEASGRWTPDPADMMAAGCRCPPNMFLDYMDRCVSDSECSCYDEESDTFVEPGKYLRRECSIW